MINDLVKFDMNVPYDNKTIIISLYVQKQEIGVNFHLICRKEGKTMHCELVCNHFNIDEIIELKMIPIVATLEHNKLNFMIKINDE